MRLIDADEAEKYLYDYLDDLHMIAAQNAIDEMPTIDAQPVKHGHWSECYRDCRCISVICSVCKNPTAIVHGCRYADEVTMDDVIERLPHCPKCCSDMRGDAGD